MFKREFSPTINNGMLLALWAGLGSRLKSSLTSFLVLPFWGKSSIESFCMHDSKERSIILCIRDGLDFHLNQDWAESCREIFPISTLKPSHCTVLLGILTRSSLKSKIFTFFQTVVNMTLCMHSYQEKVARCHYTFAQRASANKWEHSGKEQSIKGLLFIKHLFNGTKPLRIYFFIYLYIVNNFENCQKCWIFLAPLILYLPFQIPM